MNLWIMNLSRTEIGCSLEREREKQLYWQRGQGQGKLHTKHKRNLLVGVLAEDVLDDHNGFLHHIIDLGLNEVKQCADTTLCRLL